MKKKKGKPRGPGGARPGAGRPQTENLVAEFVNLDTGEVPEFSPSPYFANMASAARALKIDIAILKDARSKDCPAFRTSSNIHKEQLILWLKKNGNQHPEETPDPQLSLQGTPTSEDPEDDYTIDNEVGGVGRTLKSLQQYERKAKRALDTAEKIPNKIIRAAEVKACQDAWIKIVNALLKYDLSVSMAKRESGELIPIAEARAGVQALLAWHTVAASDALRNVIPECEGKTKYQIAALLDPALRSSIYRNFKTGVKIHKIPEWMGQCATEFIKAEKPLSMEKE